MFSSESINQIKDSLWFHMYDEIIEDIPSNDSVMTTSEIYQKISSQYLGELLIPFSTIYASQRVCFFFMSIFLFLFIIPDLSSFKIEIFIFDYDPQ